MVSRDLFQMFIGLMGITLGGCSIALVIAAWMKKEKSGTDVMMAIGATFGLVGAFGWLGAALEVEWIQSDEGGLFVLGSGTMGVVLFRAS